VHPLLGRLFINAPVDYLFIGGGITAVIFAALYVEPSLSPVQASHVSDAAFIAVNAAHFAASTVRLYTKRGATHELPILSWLFPVLCFAAVGLGLFWPRAGGHLKALYFTWSPFHYAAQTYGLSVMYAMRAGARLDPRDKQLVWWVCLLPFLHSFFTTQMGGLFWFVSRETVAANPSLTLALDGIVWALRLGVLTLPAALFWQLRRGRSRQVPLIVLVLQVSNGVWWLGSDFLNAWFWTAVLHSIQYLLVVTVRHVDERVPPQAEGSRFTAVLWHGTAFYGTSLIVGYLLFFVAPSFYVLFGFDGLEAYAMMTVMINLHHFIVDGFIWRTVRRAPAHVSSAAGLAA
jgi:hypothetical protein